MSNDYTAFEGQHRDVAALMRGEGRRTVEPQSRFTEVVDRDLVTIMERLCGSLEYFSMLAASGVMAEIDARGLWPAVVERRSALLRLQDKQLSEDEARQKAQWLVDDFRDQHFPVPPEDGDDGRAAAGWNSYLG